MADLRLRVVNDSKLRRAQDIQIAVVDGLKGGHFPCDEAALRLIGLALRNVVAKWAGSRHDWTGAMTQVAPLYPERFNIEL